jgi:hypothetical protein
MLIDALLVLTVHIYHPLVSYEVVVSCYSITVICSPFSYLIACHGAT